MRDLTSVELEQLIAAECNFLVDFWAPWCGPCKAMTPVLEKASALADNVDFVKINIQDYPALAERYKISSIPTLIFFKNGLEKTRKVGAILNPESIVALTQ